MSTTTQKQPSLVPNAQASIRKTPSIKYQPRGKRYYFDVGLGSVCLSGRDTGGAYCLLDVGLAPGMAVPRHTHTREDEVYFVLAGELQATVGDKTFVLQPGDTLLAPRDIPHELHNPATPRITFSSYFRFPGSKNSSWQRPFPRLTMRLLRRSRP